jgi:hypothetical protein
MEQVTIGSKWTTSEGSHFVVNDIVIDQRGTWVHYNRYGSDRQYNCLIEAFINRFVKDINSGYY